MCVPLPSDQQAAGLSKWQCWDLSDTEKLVPLELKILTCQITCRRLAMFRVWGCFFFLNEDGTGVDHYRRVLSAFFPGGCNLHSALVCLLVPPAVENDTANFTVFQNSLPVAQAGILSCPELP